MYLRGLGGPRSGERAAGLGSGQACGSPHRVVTVPARLGGQRWNARAAQGHRSIATTIRPVTWFSGPGYQDQWKPATVFSMNLR